MLSQTMALGAAISYALSFIFSKRGLRYSTRHEFDGAGKNLTLRRPVSQVQFNSCRSRSEIPFA
jgi:hypothetical protein